MANAGPETQGTHRIPPSWTPGTAYYRRDFEIYVHHWLRLTDLYEDKRGPAVLQRLAGVGTTLAREIPEGIVAEGARDNFGNARPGRSVLMDALRNRRGGEVQTRQLELLQAFETERQELTMKIKQLSQQIILASKAHKAQVCVSVCLRACIVCFLLPSCPLS